MDENLLKGNLEKTRFSEALVKIAGRKETGVLRVTHRKTEKTVYLQEGNVIFSQSNDPDDRLGPLLLRQNKITYRQLMNCEPKVSPEKRLGTILVLEGYIQPDDLVHGVMDQVREIIYSLFDWEEGTFEFSPGDLPTKEIITLNLSIPDLVFNGIARIRRWSWVHQGVGNLDEVFRKRSGWTTIVRKMLMTAEMEALLDLFDRPRTLEEILQLSPSGSFETSKQIWFFLIVGIIEKILQAPAWETAQEEYESPVEAMSQSAASTGFEVVEQPPVVFNAPAASVDDTGPLRATDLPESPSPTLKIETSQTVPNEFAEGEPSLESPNTETVPVSEETQKSESAETPAIPLLHPDSAESASIELSFSDLADLTDAAEQAPAVVPAVIEKKELKKEDIFVELRAFNDLHRYIFELVRLEVGSGAINFLSKSLKKSSARFPLVFEGVPMNDFGELDQHSLFLNIEGNLVENYREALEFLINEERSQIRMFLEPKRVEIIEAGLKKMQQRQKSLIH